MSDAPADSGCASKDEMPGVTFLFPPGSARTSGRPPMVVPPARQENTCTRVPVLPQSKITAYFLASVGTPLTSKVRRSSVKKSMRLIGELLSVLAAAVKAAAAEGMKPL